MAKSSNWRQRNDYLAGPVGGVYSSGLGSGVRGTVAMKLRFVAQTTLISELIVLREQIAMPFTPSHVEAVSQDCAFYIGAHIQGGIQRRPIGYDTKTMTHELILDLASTDKQDSDFWAFVETHVGEPYDWKSILDFTLPFDWHEPNHAICSAFMLLALRACKWLQWPVAAPAHLISPRDLLLMISARMEVPGI